jgi:hypothetical protein
MYAVDPADWSAGATPLGRDSVAAAAAGAVRHREA